MKLLKEATTSFFQILYSSSAIYHPTIQRSYTKGLISLWLCKEYNKLWDWKKIYSLYIFPP
jgi:hypothetical protein